MSIADYWRLEAPRFRLEATKCANCEKTYFPPKKVCPVCNNDELIRMDLSGKGRLITFTRVEKPAAEFEYMGPYYVGIVELEEGIRISASIVDVAEEQIQEGMTLELAFRKYYAIGDEGIVYYGYKFRPTL